MLAKERLHAMVNSLDDVQASRALTYLQRLVAEEGSTSVLSGVSGSEDVPARIEPDVSGQPFTFDSPLWDIVGMIHGGPVDFSEDADRYLADAYADPHEQ